MKWQVIYTLLATILVILGFIEKKAVYLITAVFIYVITIIWLMREKNKISVKDRPI